MRSTLHLVLLAAGMALAPASQAANGPLEETFTAFARCDASLFTALHTHAETWKAFAPLQSKGDISWIATADRSNSKNQANFTGAPTVAGLPISAYIDNGSDMGSLGHYLFWGFIVDAPPYDAVTRLAPLIEDKQTLHRARGVVARSEVRLGSLWQPTFNQGGIPTGMKLIERVLLFEEDAGKTRVTCSLQGAVDGPLLTELRPDIPAADHPKPPVTARIDDVPLAEGIREGLDVPLLEPRFTSLTYSFLHNRDKQGNTPMVVHIVADDGLLNVTEFYGTSTVQRVEKAGLVQLTSRSSRLAEALQTRTLKLQLPDSWAAGGTLHTEATMAFVPAGRKDKVPATKQSCTVGERYPASQLHASLAGDAIPLECSYGKWETTEAFIEDLGIAIPVEYVKGRNRVRRNYIKMEVVR